MASLFRGAVCAVLFAAGSGGQTAPAAQQITGRLTANDLRADVSFLASDVLQGRGTPSVGQDVAAQFVAAQFRRAGLEPAGDDGYFQTASYASVAPNLQGAELTFEVGGTAIKVEKGGISLQNPVGMDLPHVPIVKVAGGNTAALDAAGFDAKGKVLLVDGSDFPDGRVPRALVRTLSGRQPALIVLLQNGAARGPQRASLRETGAAAVPMVTVRDRAVHNAFADSKPGPLDATLSVHIHQPATTAVKLRNVIGVLRGWDAALKDTYVLLTAHYDHLGVRAGGEGDRIYNGANDDASGTASIIEIAETLAALPSRPRRSIVFIALFGEELGLLGSRYYVEHPVFPLAKTVADLNLEQLGRTDDETGPRVGILNATGFDFTSLTGELRKAGQEFGVEVQKDEENSDSFFDRSDNQAFADAGVPAHTLSVGYVFPDYHEPGDEWQKIDYDNMAKVDATIALATFRIADSQSAPQWNASNPKTGRYIKASGTR